MDSKFKLFFRKLPTKIILSLKSNKRKNESAIMKEINSTYSYTNRSLMNLREMRLVYFKKEGRQNIIILTEKGNKVADLLYQLKII